MIPFITFLSRPVLITSGIVNNLAVRSLSKYITNRIISKKIDDALINARNKINNYYADYWKNVILFSALNIVIVLLTIISYYFFSINNVIIIIISAISLFMMVRFFYRTIRNIAKIIPYSYQIKEYFKDLIFCKSLRIAIKERIRNIFFDIYESSTNKVSRLTHSAVAMLGFVKSIDDIGVEVVNEFYNMIKLYLIKNIFYKTIAFSIFYIIFVLLLKPLVFTFTMNMNIIEAILYPFTVVLPKVINIFTESIK